MSNKELFESMVAIANAKTAKEYVYKCEINKTKKLDFEEVELRISVGSAALPLMRFNGTRTGDKGTSQTLEEKVYEMAIRAVMQQAMYGFIQRQQSIMIQSSTSIG